MSAQTDGSRSDSEFLSGTSGGVWGIRASSRAIVADAVADAAMRARGLSWRLARAARSAPRRRVLVLSVQREDVPNLLPQALGELKRSHHEVTAVSTGVGGRGKFENLDLLLDSHPAAGFDWLLVLDDDVTLPQGFLDAFLFLAERFDLNLVQPAHRHRSHAAWAVTRRRLLSVVRESAFVEIGPVLALHASTFPALLPFPPLRFGWGLDAHWSALARDHGWRLGIVDATPIRHGLRLIASSYGREEALAESRAFLGSHPHISAVEAQKTLAVHRSWR